jgi:DNA-directed RNA polymerase specialized sigma24 family protein
VSPLLSGKDSEGLTQKAFDKLLLRLDPDRIQAAKKYEEIRRQLMKFFEWNDCLCPAELADETINRVARKIEEGQDVQNLKAYFSAIAKHVLQEYWRALKREPVSLEALSISQGSSDGSRELQTSLARQDHDSVRLECMGRCMKMLSPEERQLIMAYERGEKGARIRNRERLAKRFKMSSNALRLRVFRIKQRLEVCYRECRSELDPHSTSAPGALGPD